MLKKNSLLFFVFSTSQILFSQHFSAEEQKSIDSLFKITTTNQVDTNTVLAYFGLADYYYTVNTDSTILFCEKAREISEKIGYPFGQEESYGWLGILYQQIGNLPKAVENLHKSLKVNEYTKDTVSLSQTLSALGTAYSNMPNSFEKSYLYFTQSLALRIQLNDQIGEATVLNNIGGIYSRTNNYDSALYYYEKSLSLFQSIGFKKGIANGLNNIGAICRQKGDEEQAMANYQESNTIYTEINDRMGIINARNNIASVYLIWGKYAEARPYAELAHDLALSTGHVESIYKTASTLRKVYEKLNLINKAYDLFKIEVRFEDSLKNIRNEKSLVEKFYQFEYEKKAVEDSIENVKNQEISAAKIEQQKAELQAKKNQQYALYLGLFIVVVFAGIMFNRFKITQRQKLIIEQKEKETSLQKNIIEEKHKEITDSINYAERIQRSFLATTELLNENLKEYFVLFKPKDVVSGDFYWGSKINNGQFALCCADSTGHGVPGAIMSILNISSLEKAAEKEIAPNKILNKTREIIINRLKNDGSLDGGQDGMDCALMLINPEHTKISFALAQNTLLIIRNKTILEFKGDKMPVGKHDKQNQSFTLQEEHLEKGDMIYMFTDGFADQFGGEKGKKFKYSTLKELLLSLAEKTMEEQKSMLNNTFENWSGGFEQVDDVCVLGVRI